MIYCAAGKAANSERARTGFLLLELVLHMQETSAPDLEFVNLSYVYTSWISKFKFCYNVKTYKITSTSGGEEERRRRGGKYLEKENTLLHGGTGSVEGGTCCYLVVLDRNRQTTTKK